MQQVYQEIDHQGIGPELEELLTGLRMRIQVSSVVDHEYPDK